MSLKELVNILRKNILTILVMVIIFTLFGWYQSQKKDISYSGAITGTIYTKNQTAPVQNNYYDFYRWQSNSFFVDTIINWIASPNTQNQIYKNAGLALPAGFTTKVANKNLKADKGGLYGNVIVINHINNNQEDAEKVLISAKDVLNSQISQAKEKNLLPMDLTIDFSSTTIISEASKPYTTILISLFAGILASVIIVLIKESLK